MRVQCLGESHDLGVKTPVAVNTLNPVLGDVESAEQAGVGGDGPGGRGKSAPEEQALAS